MTEQEYKANIESSIANIKAVDIDKGWSYEMIIYEFRRIELLPIFLYTIPANYSIFRARKNDTGKIYAKTSDISAPEDKYVNSYGRANKPRQTLFYGSEARQVAFFEFAEELSSSIPVGEEFRITIGEWILKEPVSLALVINPNIPRTQSYTIKHGKAFDEHVLRMGKAYQTGTKIFFEFIAEEYAKQAEDDTKSYFITCAYSNIVFQDKSCDGIIYPSVPTAGNGFNVALKQEIVPSLSLKSAATDSFEVKSLESGGCGFRNNGRVMSRKASPETIEWAKVWTRF